MKPKTKLFLLVSYTLFLFVICLYPRYNKHQQSGEISSRLSPKEGDNFKAVNQAAVFRLMNGKKRKYLSDTSFFSYPNNKKFDVSYPNGGILICDTKTVAAIPYGDYMPKNPNGIAKKFEEKKYWDSFWSAFFRKDKAGHALGYFVWSFLFLFYLMPYPFTFSKKILITILLGSIIGISLEYLQANFSVGRDAEYLDMFFNWVGILLGIGFYWRFIHSKKQLIS